MSRAQWQVLALAVELAGEATALAAESSAESSDAVSVSRSAQSSPSP